jgi:hypothetical protein
VRGTWQTTGSSGGGGGLVIVVVAAVVLIGSGAATAAARAITSLLVTIAVVLGSAITLAALGSAAWLVYRARQGRPGRPVLAPVVYEQPRERPVLLEASQPRAAIEPPREIHIHIHGADATRAAAIIRQAIPGTAGDANTEGK